MLKEGVERRRRTRALSYREGGLNLDICAGVPELLVTPVLMGPVCLISQDLFEEPVHPCLHKTATT